VCEAEVWVLPNPSGLNGHYQLPQLAEIYSARKLGARWLRRSRFDDVVALAGEPSQTLTVGDADEAAMRGD
jgi:hypothetical protein